MKSKPDNCPWCNKPPFIGLSKKTGCQLHGEPTQSVVIACYWRDCPAKPRISAGDIYGDGKEVATDKAIAIWNTRAIFSIQMPKKPENIGTSPERTDGVGVSAPMPSTPENKHLADEMMMAYIDGREGQKVTNYGVSAADIRGMKNVLAYLVKNGYFASTAMAAENEELKARLKGEIFLKEEYIACSKQWLLKPWMRKTRDCAG